MECDAEKKILIHDVTGTFTGRDGEVFIIPQSDRAWDHALMTKRGLGDYRIPAAMWTDVNGERLSVDQVKPYTGISHGIMNNLINQMIKNNIYISSVT